MRPTDNDPKGNDPIDRDPTNEEIVDHLQRGLVMRMHFCPLIGKRVGKKLTTFEFRTKFDGAEYRFEGMWLDGTGTKVLAGLINKEYSRGKAISSLIDDKCFPSVEAWVVACRNALGDNIDTFPLAGCIFVDGQCVDELIDAADAALAVKATEEKNFSDKVAQMDVFIMCLKSDAMFLAAEVKKMQRQVCILTQIVTQLCVQTGC